MGSNAIMGLTFCQSCTLRMSGAAGVAEVARTPCLVIKVAAAPGCSRRRCCGAGRVRRFGCTRQCRSRRRQHRLGRRRMVLGGGGVRPCRGCGTDHLGRRCLFSPSSQVGRPNHKRDSPFASMRGAISVDHFDGDPPALGDLMATLACPFADGGAVGATDRRAGRPNTAASARSSRSPASSHGSDPPATPATTREAPAAR